jgi:hypothetical protein
MSPSLKGNIWSRWREQIKPQHYGWPEPLQGPSSCQPTEQGRLVLPKVMTPQIGHESGKQVPR